MDGGEALDPRRQREQQRERLSATAPISPTTHGQKGLRLDLLVTLKPLSSFYRRSKFGGLQSGCGREAVLGVRKDIAIRQLPRFVPIPDEQHVIFLNGAPDSLSRRLDLHFAHD
jgi:hypothetical protein